MCAIGLGLYLDQPLNSLAHWRTYQGVVCACGLVNIFSYEEIQRSEAPKGGECSLGSDVGLIVQDSTIQTACIYISHAYIHIYVIQINLSLAYKLGRSAAYCQLHRYSNDLRPLYTLLTVKGVAPASRHMWHVCRVVSSLNTYSSGCCSFRLPQALVSQYRHRVVHAKVCLWMYSPKGFRV